jgi:uncharacterized protein (DUF1330 family)
MTALVIVLGNPRADLPDVLKEYQTVTGAAVTRAGGQVLGRGKLAKALIGAGGHRAGIVLRFPSIAAVEQWYNDPEYQKVLPLRQQIFGDSLQISAFEE